MSALLPVILAISLALVMAFATYRGIRRGGARFYTLEREAVLRRAMLTLALTVLLFLGAVGFLIYERQQFQTELAVQAGETVEGVPTATVRICRAVVRGTAGSGLNLRDTPGGTEVETLQEESILTLLEEAPIQQGGFTWVKVRTVALNEGWVALDFLFISDEECLSRVGQ